MTTKTITIQGPAIVIHGFDRQAGRYVCQQFTINQCEQAEAFKQATGPHFLMYSSFHGAERFPVNSDDVSPDAARAMHDAALGRWFGDFDTAE
jgi:hypothetical protein